MRRLWLPVFFMVLAAVVVAAPLGSATRPDVIQIPIPGFQPEGIAVGKGGTFYVGSIPTGAVVRGDLRTGACCSPVVPARPGPDGRRAIGVAFDQRHDRLFVAGGPTGKAFVYDANTGADIAVFQLASVTDTFVNDVVVTKRGAFFTDSRQQVLYRIPFGRHGVLGAAQAIPLTGEIAYTTTPSPFNANGIEARRGGKTLVIVQTNLGKLFKVNSKTGSTREIVLSGGDVTAGDGLLLRGRTLFVVQNELNRVAVVKVRRGLRQGRIVAHITDPDLDVPATIDAFRGRLYAVNARFGTPSPETALYQVVKLRFPRGEDD